jgi:cation-transporting P-type ATPase E
VSGTAHALTERLPPRAEGLTQAEAERRLAARGEVEPPTTSRSWRSILRANLLTVFNVVLVVFGLITLIFADWRDALFLGILIINAGIGIVQEARAKRSLDRLAALVAPKATVVRDGRPREVAIADVVPGDLVVLGAGDQVVADGRVVRSESLGVDESILTGESEPVTRGEGEALRAGSFAVEGSGAYVAEAVGHDTYGERIVGEAREFRHPRSPLERGLDRLILVLTAATVPLGAILLWSLFEQDVPFREAVETSAAAVITLVPEGLVLLTGITYAIATLRMTRRGALSQQLNAVESLASADTVCLDKTGTLTEDRLRVVALEPADGTDEGELSVLLGRYAASSPSRNSTLEAIADAYPGAAEPVRESVPFSSRRRWSGLSMGGRSYVLGAPEHFALGGRLEVRARQEAAEGRRVLGFAVGDGPVAAPEADSPPPAGLRPLGLIVLAEELRPDARETVAFLLEQGVDIRVISGDAPATVAAIAADAGIPIRGEPVDGRELPPDAARMREIARDSTVVGRISPEGKRRYVEALAAEGRYVAMVGDGVNDVPALKAARLAIAQGSGAQMARAVADLVLVKGGFASIPAMIGEGRKLLRNLQRVAKLFVAKSALAAFLILTVGISSESYPFLPRHLTLASFITIGVPAFFLALAPSEGPWRPARFLRNLASFAIPAGTAAGLGVVAGFLISINLIDMNEVRARTVATTVLVCVGLYLVVVLEASSKVRGYAVAALCAALLALYVVVLSLPGWRDFFEVAAPDPAIILVSLVGTALAVAGLALTDERFLPFPPRRPPPPPAAPR